MSVSAHLPLMWVSSVTSCCCHLLTSTPSHYHGSEEGDEISLPHDQTDHEDHILSESWGEVNEEFRRAEEGSEIEDGALNQSTTLVHHVLS